MNFLHIDLYRKVLLSLISFQRSEFAFTLIDNAIVVNLFYGLLDTRCTYHQELWQHNRKLPTRTCDRIGK